MQMLVAEQLVSGNFLNLVKFLKTVTEIHVFSKGEIKMFKH